MIALVENVEFWKALAAILWPVLAIIIFISAKSRIYAFLSRDNVSIKVAGMEISVADAAKSLGTSVSDLQKRLAELEVRVGRPAGENEIGPSSKSPVGDVSWREKATDTLSTSQQFSILWVDDYPSNNAFLVDQFQKEGIEIKLALTTDEGVKDFNNGDFDMIITDLGRRENGKENPFAGLDLIRQVRAQDMDVPILVFAGSRGLQNRGKLLKAGATEVSQSAVDVQSFVSGVQERTQSGKTKLTS
jgi:CheY-like chemotaxis protein